METFWSEVYRRRGEWKSPRRGFHSFTKEGEEYNQRPFAQGVCLFIPNPIHRRKIYYDGCEGDQLERFISGLPETSLKRFRPFKPYRLPVNPYCRDLIP